MGRRWAITVLAVLISAPALAASWQMSGRDRDEPPWGPMGPAKPAMQPLTPGALIAIGGALAGLAVMRLRPRLGFSLTMGSMVLLGAQGAFGGFLIVPGAFASAFLVAALGLGRAWPWLPLTLLPLWSTWWHEPWLGLASERTWTLTIAASLWMLVPALIVGLRQARRSALARERADELRQAAYNERLRVARDIHDVVGHALSMISLQSGVALRLIDDDPAQVRTSLEAIRGSSKEALAEVRRTLEVFRTEDEDEPLSPTPGLEDLPALVQAARSGGVAVTLTAVPSAAGIGSSVAAVAYRVVQEALTNALRHAPGSQVTITLHRGDDLRIVVADDGAPPETFVEGGGLRGMRERLSALGGTLTVASSPGGFQITAVLPLTTQEPHA
ncbi:MAG: sensor histidine kinase [Propioniciclava sp.]